MVKDIIRQFKEEYKGSTNGFEKYFQVDRCVKAKQRIYDKLEIPPNSSILDIGSGFGYFPYICQAAGHQVTMTDVCLEWDDLCTQAREALGLPQAVPFAYDNHQFKELPDIGKFDLITAFACSPHSFFTIDDWNMYIQDCSKHLNNKGRIYIEPNNSKGKDNLSTILKPFHNGYIHD